MPTETQDGSREWIAVVECTLAGQFMLPPMVIYKGKGIYRGWTSTIDDAEALFAHSDKAFITDNLAFEWLHRFDAWTSIRAAVAPRFLLLDSHRTHYSLQLYAMQLLRSSSCPIQGTQRIYYSLSMSHYSPHCSLLMAVATHTRTTRTGVSKALF